MLLHRTCLHRYRPPHHPKLQKTLWRQRMDHQTPGKNQRRKQSSIIRHPPANTKKIRRAATRGATPTHYQQPKNKRIPQRNSRNHRDRKTPNLSHLTPHICHNRLSIKWCALRIRSKNVRTQKHPHHPNLRQNRRHQTKRRHEQPRRTPERKTTTNGRHRP